MGVLSPGAGPFLAEATVLAFHARLEASSPMVKDAFDHVLSTPRLLSPNPIATSIARPSLKWYIAIRRHGPFG